MKCHSLDTASVFETPSPGSKSEASGRGISMTSSVIAIANTASVKNTTRSGVWPGAARFVTGLSAMAAAPHWWGRRMPTDSTSRLVARAARPRDCDGMTVVNDLDLAEVDISGAELAGDNYHLRLAQLVREGEHKWLARSPLAYLVLDRDSAEFFLRSRDTAFPGREIAELFGVNAGRLREQIDANILNQQGEQHRRLRALVGPAFTPRAAERWRPFMRDFLAQLWADVADEHACEFVTAIAKPYPS